MDEISLKFKDCEKIYFIHYYTPELCADRSTPKFEELWKDNVEEIISQLQPFPDSLKGKTVDVYDSYFVIGKIGFLVMKSLRLIGTPTDVYFLSSQLPIAYLGSEGITYQIPINTASLFRKSEFPTEIIVSLLVQYTSEEWRNLQSANFQSSGPLDLISKP